MPSLHTDTRSRMLLLPWHYGHGQYEAQFQQDRLGGLLLRITRNSVMLFNGNGASMLFCRNFGRIEGCQIGLPQNGFGSLAIEFTCIVAYFLPP